ncbi:transposase [Streptomyces sp. NPDC087659]|uniref:transposase n=1 Tax=Streptomyces sp. NPDC087659 TaxID=3365801 RepID=UPI003817C05F
MLGPPPRSWSAGLTRDDSALSLIRGVLPIPASSGLTHRHRLNRSGDRQLNRAMHTIILLRMRLAPSTKTYVARKIAEGKTSRDAQRCLKRVICRQIFKILERTDRNRLGNVRRTRSSCLTRHNSLGAYTRGEGLPKLRFGRPPQGIPDLATCSSVPAGLSRVEFPRRHCEM